MNIIEILQFKNEGINIWNCTIYDSGAISKIEINQQNLNQITNQQNLNHITYTNTI